MSRRRDGTYAETYDSQAGVIRWLYETKTGGLVLGILIRPWVSRIAGRFLDSRISACLISPFIRKNQISLKEYVPTIYRSFNDFFTREIRRECRPVASGKHVMVSPCDSKLSVSRISPELRFQVKGVPYTLSSLLRNRKLAEQYQNGLLMIFRLTVDDYHHYCFPANGDAGGSISVPGVYHTVNPIAAEHRGIYRENSREYMVCQTDEFGPVIMMEVGAMMVGRICNTYQEGRVRRGEEKGKFEFGGSTVILIIQDGQLEVDTDLLSLASNGEEVIVKMGEQIGTAASVKQTSEQETNNKVTFEF